MKLIENLKNIMIVEDNDDMTTDIKDVVITLYEPVNREQTVSMVQDLKMNKAIVLNINKLSSEDRIRVTDVLLGAILAIGGRNLIVTDTVCLYAPKGVNVNSFVDAEETEETSL